MATKKPNFGKGFTVNHHDQKQTALDKFQTADAFINGRALTRQETHPSELLAEDSSVNTVAQPVTDAPPLPPKFSDWCRAHGYRSGTIIDLAISKLKTSPFNPRHFYQRQSISTLAVNLHSQKQQLPILVTPDYDEEGTFFIVDGGRRVRALRESNEENASAIVIHVEMGIESYRLGRDVNTQRETQTAFDDAMVWRQLLDDKLFATQSALADYLSVDKSVITATLAIAELPTSIIEMMVDNAEQFGMNMAYNVVKYFRVKGQKETEVLVQRIIADGLPVRKVAEICRRATDSSPEAPKSRTRYAERIDLRIGDNVQVGTMCTYGEDRLELKLKGLSRDQRDDVQQRIQSVLNEFISRK